MEKLENQIIGLLPDIQEAINAWVSYWWELFIRYVHYLIFENLVILIVLLSFTYFFAYWFNYFLKKSQKADTKKEEYGYYPILGIIGLSFCTCFTLLIVEWSESIFNLWKLFFIPEVIVLEILTK